MAPMAAAVTAQTIQAAVATQPTAAMVHQQQVVAAVTQSSTNHSLPPNVNQLLPSKCCNMPQNYQMLRLMIKGEQFHSSIPPCK